MLTPTIRGRRPVPGNTRARRLLAAVLLGAQCMSAACRQADEPWPTVPAASAVLETAANGRATNGRAANGRAANGRAANGRAVDGQTVHGHAMPALEPAAGGRHATTIMLGTSAALAMYGRRHWWREGFRGRFTATREGWFGADTYSGGADKLGHFYMTYASARLLTGVFAWDGASHPRALQLAAAYTLGAYAAIEVLDGLSRQWRFSPEDMLMNAAGVGAGAVLELYPELDRKLDLRVLYRPSREEGRRFDPFGDYSGQTYLAVMRLAGFDAVPRTSWLRYVELAAGYGTRGYLPSAHRRGIRSLSFGVSFNLAELLPRPGSEPVRSLALARTTLEFVQLPGTALLARHNLRGSSAAGTPPTPPGP